MRIEGGSGISATSERFDTNAGAQVAVDARVAAEWDAPASRPAIATTAQADVRISAVTAGGGKSAELAEARVHMALAADVYNDTPNPPAGWEVAGADDLVWSVRLFDVYRDDARLGAGLKSLAFALRFRADHTLTIEEATAARDAAVAAAAELGARLRT